MSKEERRVYERYLSNLASENDIIEGAREEGKAEGIEQGIEQEREKIVKNMLKLGMSVEDIASITGVGVGEIQGLEIR